MNSEFLRVARNRRNNPEAAKVVLRLKAIAASWDQKPDDISDEEAFRILQQKTWINLQRSPGLNEDLLRDISVLADFPELTGLCLWNNAITSIASLEGLTKLERLGLRGNQVADLTPIRRMSRLEELEIEDNPIRDLSILAQLPLLRDLEISSDQLPGLAGIASLDSVRSLQIDGRCQDLRALPALPNLRVLRLGNCSSLEGIERFHELRNLYTRSGELRDLSPLAGLAKLTHLNIGHNQVETLEPLRRLFALRDLWAGRNQIRSVEPLTRLPVLHEIVLRENPIPPPELDAFERTLSSWDDEFANPDHRFEPALALEIVSQEVWDHYDCHPFNMGDYDGDAGMIESEKSWFRKKLESALAVDWDVKEDLAVPWEGPQARSQTVCLFSGEAAASLRSIATSIQRVLGETRREFIVYLQADCGADDDYLVWVYRDRLQVTPKHAPVVTALLSQ